MSYEDKLKQEAQLWGTVAAEKAQQTPPDWRYHQYLRHNVLLHRSHINTLLNHIQPGMTCLELGCGSGWLSLAMAQAGAEVFGFDISEEALDIARDYYHSIQDEVSGTVSYEQVDLNYLDLTADTYDVIAIKGTLHHLVNLPHVITALHASLKPGGILWVSDENGDVNSVTALVSAGLMFVLPTHLSYREKFAGLRQFGFRSTSRIKASMEAEGLSPFEGAGRDHDWLTLIKEQFYITQQHKHPAVMGYITHQINMPDAFALPLLSVIKIVDQFCVRLGLLKSTGIVIYAQK